MRKTLALLLSLVLLALLPTHLNAQWAQQTALSDQMQYYAYKEPGSKLFVHFDKTVYTNNETVWFTGYLLNLRPSEVRLHELLSVALVRAIDSVVIVQEKYQIINGLAFGSMILPDSMLTGNYHFQVTTNRVSRGIPELSFAQPLIIKTNIEPSFKASLKLLQAGVPGKSPHKVLVSVLSREARFLPKPVAISYNYGQLHKKAATNASGEFIMDIPETENLTDPNVYTKLKYGKDSSYLNLPLPVTKRRAHVGFYPEGGNLVFNLPCKVAWELKDQQGAVVTSKALLYAGAELVDTIETNSYGVGKFILVPQKDITYRIKLLHSAFADSNYVIPKAVENGLSISFSTGIPTDTLVFRLTSTNPGKVALRLHDFRATYVYNELPIGNTPSNIKIPLGDVPPGLKTLTLSDSLGRPLAERLFYAHYQNKQKVQVSTDRQSYGQREKVKLWLNLNQPDTIALVSIACVQENRLPPSITTDIESYTKLSSELTDLPAAPDRRGIANRQYLEDILLVKGWRRYNWQHILQASPADTLKTYDALPLRIQIRRHDKALKSAVELGIMSAGRLTFKKSDLKGDVQFDNSELLVAPGSKIQAIVMGKNQDTYGMQLNDPFIKLNKDYTKLIAPQRTIIPSTIQNNTELTLKSNEKVNRLREVEIRAGGDQTLNYKHGANECGDYVCRFNILNCRNHLSDPGNRHPIPGQTYTDGLGGGIIVYQLCKDEERRRFIMPLPGIYTKKEFYVDPHTEPLEPAFESTLYWNHGLIIGKEAKELVFYTGDITGKFRIVVQGMSTTDVLYGQYTIEVKAK
ncbi:hypothetical protein ABIE26_002158 [Pedobacter africanus]|uniref:Uncharacterized protein n=1 Tax=Pedobacter africanus TaxID=151894 RepID=A0ACC6KYJ9_9SPHI|nr:hypothetical protein [Pedobacter africanus]MDR6784453.1 hypothetical protein [Pedobacter africanus]